MRVGEPLRLAVAAPADRAAWSDSVRLAGLVGLASCLPLVVTTWWYDFYYWPKVVALYTVLLVLTTLALLTDRERWLRSLRSPIGRALLAWLAVVAASTLFSVDPLVSLVGADYRYEGLWTWMAYGALVAGVAATFTTVQRIRVLLAWMLAAAGGMAILGLLQHLGWNPVPTDQLRVDWTTVLWGRAWGTTGNPLALGAYLVLLLPPAIILYTQEARPAWRWVYGGLVVLLYAALLATRTRGAWGALALGGVAWVVAAGLARLRPAAGPLVVLALFLAAVTPAVLWTGPLTQPGSGAMRPVPPLAAQVANRQTAEQRAFLWRTTLPLVWQRPLLGWGPETLGEVYPAYGSAEFLRLFPEAQMMRLTVDRPHNDLLQQAVSTGLVGFAVYLWLWGSIFRAAWRTSRVEHTQQHTAELAAGLLAGVVAYFFQLQFSFNYVSVAPVFWTIAGILVALERSARNRGSLMVLNRCQDGKSTH